MRKHARSAIFSRRAVSWSASFRWLRVSPPVVGAVSVLALWMTAAPRARAANTDLYWDTNGATTGIGGTGTWDTTTPNWSTDPTGASATTAYNNAAPSTVTAHFGGTVGTVTIATGVAINVNTLNFDLTSGGNTGYTIAGGMGSALNLSGAIPTIVSNFGTQETVSAAVTGTAGFTETNATTTGIGSSTTANGYAFRLQGDLSGLSGTVNVGNGNTTSGGGYVALGTGAANYTSSQFQTWNIAANGLLTGNNQGTGYTYSLGALSGAGILRGGATNGAAPAGTDTFQIGALNTNTAFAGTIVDKNTSGAVLTAITKVGSGTLTLTGTNTYTGGTVITGGTLQVGSGGTAGSLSATGTITDNGALVFNRTDTLTQGANFSAGIIGSGSLTQAGSGTLALSGTNTYTGGTAVNGGTLALGAGGGAGVVRGVVTVNSGATLSLTGGNALGYSAGSQVTALNINGGTVSVSGNQGDEGFLTSFNLTGGTLAYASTNGSAYQIAAGDATAPKITSNASPVTSLISGGINIRSGNLPIVVAGGTTPTKIDLGISGPITGGFPITKSGGGVLALNGFSTFTGGTTVNGGTLVLNAGGTGSGTVRGAVTVNSGATLSLTAGDVLGYNAGAQVTTINVNGGTVDNATNVNEGFLTSFSLTGGTVSSTGGGNYNFNAGGSINSDGTGGSPGITSNASNVVSTISGGIDIRGGTLAVAVASGTTASGTDLLISGAIVDGGALTKTGSGTLAFTANNTYSGVTNIGAGTLIFSGNGSLYNNGSATGALNVASGATVQFNRNDTLGANNVISPVVVTVNGGTLAGNNTFTSLSNPVLNGATINSNGGTNAAFPGFSLRGTVTVGGAAATNINVGTPGNGFNNVAIGTNGSNDTVTFNVARTTSNPAVDLNVNTFLSNMNTAANPANGLTKTGAGIMALNGANTYTGPTTVSAGTLLVNGNSTAATGAVTVNSDGTSAGTGTLGGTGTVGGATTVTGIITGGTNGTVGTLKLTAPLTINGTYVADVLTTGGTGTNDTLNLTGYTLTLGGSSTLAINGTFGALQYVLATYSSLVNNNHFANVTTNSAAGAPAGYAVDYGPGAITLDAVPEPGTWAGGLLLLGSLGHSCRRFGRQRAEGRRWKRREPA